ncbi:hypothetical protein L6452_38399 [Arctium lappa]|uniref:Uncharacterized protein n=1 Tax=Arctium lappa TaxID=4217 RepID=A0ACB8Y505_ARCLA|nr:hypothetical protein L6452_38399 [Arctium lappa]
MMNHTFFCLNILPSISRPNSRFTLSPKDQGLRVLDLAKEASQPSLAPISSLDEPKEPPTAPSFGPVSSLDEAKDAPAGAPASSPVSNGGKEAASPTSLWDGMSSVLEEAKKTLGPVTSSIVNEAEAVLNPVSPSILGLGEKPSSPVPAMAPTIADGGEAETPVSYPNSIALPPSPSGFFDHDVALAIESRIKQSQTDAQLAMDEAKKLLNDPNIASSETGKCLSKCVEKYGASLNQLNTAITDLGVRDVTLLADDFSAVEADIGSCQACFSENMGEDSPMKALEEATTKAARECLTVMDYAS